MEIWIYVLPMMIHKNLSFIVEFQETLHMENSRLNIWIHGVVILINNKI